MKRPYGTGQLYEKNGSYYGRWRTPDGRRLNRRIGPVRERGASDGLTRAQAETAFRKLQAAEATKSRSASRRESRTVDFAATALRERLAIEGARPSYQQNCESMHRVHISPSLGGKRLESVTREDVERLGRSMLARGLAPKTVRNVMTFLHAVFALSVANEWVAANPVTRAARPKRRRHGDANPDLRFLTLAQLDAVLRVSVDQIVSLGAAGLVLAAVTTAATLATTHVLGRWLGIDRRLTLLVGAGSAICGASAIAAMAPIARAGQEHISYATAVVTLMGTAGMFATPVLGSVVFGLSPELIGM